MRRMPIRKQEICIMPLLRSGVRILRGQDGVCKVHGKLWTAKPMAAQDATNQTIGTRNLKRATNAPTPIIAELHSNGPPNPLGQRTWYAKNRARLRMTPTTAAVMPVKGAVKVISP